MNVSALRLLSVDQLWPVVILAVAFMWLVGVAWRRPAMIVGLALGLYTYESLFGAPSGLSAKGILLYPRDAIYLAMAVAAAIRLLGPGASGRLSWAWWGLIALTCASFTRGLHSLGANSAGNDVRGVFYLASAIAFIATQRPDTGWIRSVLDIWIGLALVLAFAGFARMLGVTVGSATSQEALAGGRAIYAGPTLMIGQAALMAFFAKPLGSRWQQQRWVPYVLLFAVLAFRHRTVWLMMIVSLAAMWTVLRPESVDQGLTKAPRGRGLAVLGATMSLVVLMVGGGTVSTFRSQLDQSAASVSGAHSTSTWRVDGWKYLLKAQSANATALIVGIPYGSGYTRKVGNVTVKVSPHSWYVQTIARAGVIGFIFLVSWLYRLFRTGRRSGLLPANLGALLVLSSAVYGIAYQPTETQGILLGLVAVAAVTKAIEQRDRDATGSATQRI